MYTKKQRIFAIIICTTFIIVTLFSILFIIKEADHDCAGEDCYVCECIHHAEQTLNQISQGYIGNGILIFDIPLLIALFYIPIFILFMPCISLISQKVRLNN